MHRTRIKICGVCRTEDALFAAAAGADAVGMVRHEPARRYSDSEVVRDITSQLPAFVTPVALYVNADPDRILQSVLPLGIHTVQLHGHEPPEDVRRLAPLNVLKAIRVDRVTFERDLDAWRNELAAGGLSNLRGLILETAGPGVGGTGQANDWSFIAEVKAKGGFEGLPPIIAAGGLTSETVGEVVRTIGPWAVDVSSGVERVKRQKDPALIEQFVAAVRSADL